MYDADKLRESLSVQTIKNLLRTLGAEDIVDKIDENGTLITNTVCHNEQGGSHKLYYIEENSYFHCFTNCGSLSIYDIVIERHKMKGIELTFPEAIQWVAVETGQAFSFNHNNLTVVRSEEIDWLESFGEGVAEAPELKYYPEEVLQVFSHHGGHEAFTGDNISFEAMNRFQIRYSWYSNSLIIPHRYHKNGHIIGAMSRNLNRDEVEAGFKYVPTRFQKTQMNFPKHLNIYGFWENRENILKGKKVSIFESEKSVLQCETYFGRERNFAVALGGKNLSDEHLKILIDSGVKEVTLNFDKDYEELNSEEAKEFLKHTIKVGQKLAPYMRVFFVADVNNKLSYKDSPSDKGKKVLEELYRNRQELFSK